MRSGPLLCGLAVMLLAVIHGAIAVQTHVVDASDSPRWLQMSLNTAVHGVISYDDHQLREVTPTRNRPPFYALMAALAIRAHGDAARHSVACIIEQANPGCRAVVRSVQVLNLASFVGLAAATFLLGYVLGGARLGFIGGLFVSANTFFASQVAVVSPEILAALLVTLASLCLVLCYRRPDDWRPWFMAGLLLGALSLTKSAFSYAAPIIGLVAFVAWRCQHVRFQTLLVPVAAAMIIAASFPAAWILRNAVVFAESELTVDEQGGNILGIRASYATMEWREYLPALVSFSPVVGEPLMKKLFDPRDIERLLLIPGRQRNTFYVEHDKIVMDAAMRLDPRLGNASKMRRAAAVISHNLDKHIALTPVFLYRGLYPHTGSGDYRQLTAGTVIEPLTAPMIAVTIALSTFAMLALLAAPLLVLVKRADMVWFAVVILPLYSVAFHAGLTHYIGRYSNPLIAVGLVVLAAGLIQVFNREAPRVAK